MLKDNMWMVGGQLINFVYISVVFMQIRRERQSTKMEKLALPDFFVFYLLSLKKKLKSTINGS